MKRYDINLIKPGCFFSAALMLDERFTLASPETRITRQLLDALREWNFTDVYSAGEPREDYQGAGRAKENEFVQNDGEKLREAEFFYADMRHWTATMLEMAVAKQPVRFSDAAAKVKEMLDEIGENRRFLLQALKDVREENAENFLVSHAVKSAVIALVIGASMKLPAHRLIELGVAALTHEIGMTRLPSHTYLGQGDLNQADRDLIAMHPQLGYEILRASEFPLPVCEPALEHHERESGGGYPHKLRGDSIGLYSKIIAVACSYEAITAIRPHKDARNAYQGMLELLRNEGRRYNEAVLNALVRSLSIFPIGQYVVLSNNKKGQVIDTDPSNPRYPIVQVFGELTPDGKNKILATNPAGVFIAGVIEGSDARKSGGAA